MIHYNTLIVLSGTALLGASAGLVGSFVVLRRQALTGDALAHAALPGLCVAFLIVGERSLGAMLFGAFVSGILAILVLAGLRHASRIKEDAAIGIVLSVFFGAGIVLSRWIQAHATGGAKAGLDSYLFGKTAGMIAEDVLGIGIVSAMSLLVLGIFYKEFEVVAFDLEFARAQGWPAAMLDAILLALVASTVVAGLPAVGVVLVAALLILPAASARFWTDSLGRMLLLATGFGAGVCITGAMISSRLRATPTGPVIVLVGTIWFLVSLLLGPRRGILARWRTRRAIGHRLSERRMLALLGERAATGAPWIRLDERIRLGSGSAREADAILGRLARAKLIEPIQEGQTRLTPLGRQRAAEEVRELRFREALDVLFPEWSVEAWLHPDSSPSELVPAEVSQQVIHGLKASGRWPELADGAR